MDIPPANQHASPEKCGYLSKLSNRFPYLPQWRRRYCVLTEGKLYYYEKEESRGGTDKNNGLINLEYFDEIFEASPKDSKKATNVFILTSHDRSFFDPGRHYFSADTLTDLHDWIRKIRGSLNQNRNNNRNKTNKTNRHSSTEQVYSQVGTTDEEEIKCLIEDSVDKKTPSSSNQSTRERNKNKQDQNKEQYYEDGMDSDEKKKSSTKPSIENKIIGKNKSPLIMEGLLGMTSKNDLNKIQQKNNSTEFDSLETSQKLESITKRRPRPKDRKPPTKRITTLNQRASSLNALQAENSEEEIKGSANEGAPLSNRSSQWLNRSLDLLEEENSIKRNAKQINRSSLAYNYSSDESDNDLSRSGSFITSASGIAPVPPPRLSSFPASMHPPIPGPKPKMPNIPLGSLPSLHDMDMKSSYGEQWRGSTCSAEVSPFMDDLDNFFMNESVQPATPIESPPSSAGGSDISTCKAVGEPAPKSPTPEAQLANIYNSKASDGYSSEDIIASYAEQETLSTPDLDKFTITTRHLQSHIVELEQDVQNFTTEILEMKSDVSSLQDSMKTIKSDAERVGETVTILSQEAARASRQIVSAAQEAEKTRKFAAAALEDAEKTKGEYIKLKNEYEEIVNELRTTLATLKAGAQKHKQSIDASQGNRSLERRHGKSSSNSSTLESNKSSSKDESQHKTSGYQSLFVRPSSIISGLANRSSFGKSVSFADQNSKKKKDSENGIKKEKNSEPRKEEKTEKKLFGSLERKQKSKSVDSPISSKVSSFVTGSQIKSKSRKYFSEAQRAMSNETLDDIPMMDENPDKPERPRSAIGFAKITPTTQSMDLNFDLGKSSSSPSVPNPPSSLRPKILALSPKSNSYSNKDSPDSPGSSTVFLHSGYSAVPTPPSHSVPNVYRPSSACGQLKRQSSMSTVPEDHVINEIHEPIKPPPPPTTISTAKARFFGMARQNSTPNLQRQNSSPLIPLQRQHSLGTVPEENKLPRQDSVSSILDNRAVVDCTLPLSPAESIQCLPVEQRASRASIRNSLEMVTGPIIAGSSFEVLGQNNQVFHFTGNSDDIPLASSSLKKKNRR